MSEKGSTEIKIQIIIEAIENERVLRFWYDGFEREVDPYVFGLSSQNNPLMRGYQVRGGSVSGKGPGWRIFQVNKMVDVEFTGDYFDPDYSDYDPNNTWIWEPKILIY